MEQTRDFYTSAIFWKDLKDQALLVKKIQEQLNNILKLEQYGTGLKTIIFVPIAQLGGPINAKREKPWYTSPGNRMKRIATKRVGKNKVQKINFYFLIRSKKVLKSI